MASARQPAEGTLPGFIRFHDGTDQASATSLDQNGVDQQHAAAWNGSGKFWATTDQHRAQWFVRSHPGSPPAARFDFDLPDMREQPIYTVWKIACRSSDEIRTLQQWFAGRIDLDRIFSGTVRVIPGGVEQVRKVQHRLGDYFTDIQMLPATETDPGSFRLVFRKDPQAGRFWKDLMVNILQEIEDASRNVSIDLDSKSACLSVSPHS